MAETVIGYDRQSPPQGGKLHHSWDGPYTSQLLWMHSRIQWMRSISFPRVDPHLPPVRSNSFYTSFQGLTRVNPKCPTCGVGHLGLAWGAWRHHERVSERSISSCQGLTRMSTAGSTQGSLSNAHNEVFISCWSVFTCTMYYIALDRGCGSWFHACVEPQCSAVILSYKVRWG